MKRTERRTNCIRFLARLDQQIAEAESLAADKRLNRAERRLARAELSYRRRVLTRVEKMLADIAQ